jgi:hypothetical protein
VTDAPSLVEKLNAVGGVESRTAVSGLGAAALTERLTAGSDIFGQRLTVAFDGMVVHPAIRYAVTPAPDDISPILATIRLTGLDSPRRAPFTWTYSWTFASTR